MSSRNNDKVKTRVEHVRLPKLKSSSNFRIRSSSKQKSNEKCEPTNSKIRQHSDVSKSKNKYRSSSLKPAISRKSLFKKWKGNNSSDLQNSEAEASRLNSKPNDISCKEDLEKEHENNMRKLQNIAKLFDPKTIMKMGRKSSQCSQEESQRERQNKGKVLKGQIRLNQYVFEGKKSKNGSSEKVDQFWRQVNESMILTACKNNEEYVSKDLLDIYDTLVTE